MVNTPAMIMWDTQCCTICWWCIPPIPKMGVPLNHPFQYDFPLPSIYGNPHLWKLLLVCRLWFWGCFIGFTNLIVWVVVQFHRPLTDHLDQYNQSQLGCSETARHGGCLKCRIPKSRWVSILNWSSMTWRFLGYFHVFPILGNLWKPPHPNFNCALMLGWLFRT